MLPNIKRTSIVFAICLAFALVLLTTFAALAQNTTPPLSVPGSYGVGQRTYTLVDNLRNDREIPLVIWYPTTPPASQRPYIALQKNAMPLMDDAPYPIVVYSHGACFANDATFEIAPTLASYGFVVISGEHYPPVEDVMMRGCGGEPMVNIVHRPLDVRFMLDALPTLDEDLAPILDLEHIGIVGFSDGAFTAVTTSGAQVDPAVINAFCAGNNSVTCSRLNEWWDQIMAIQALYGIDAQDELWANLADSRISATMSIAVCHTRLYGETGISMLETPVLVLAAQYDETYDCSYDEALFLEDHYNSDGFFFTYTLRNSISGYGPHISLANQETRNGRHFAVAFFSYILKGDEDYLPYIDVSYIENVGDWQAGTIR